MRSQRVQVLAATVLGLISVLILWVGPVDGAARAETDTVHYTQRAYELAGYDHDTATDKAVRFVCADEADYKDMPAGACEATTTGVLGFPAQYQAIFHARPGFPALMSMFIRVFGDQGIYLTVLALQVATGVLLMLAARAAGLPGLWPLAAEAAYFLLPSGFDGTRVLSEAASALGLVALLYAVALMVRDTRGTRDTRDTHGMPGSPDTPALLGKPRNAALALAVAAFAWLFAVRAVDAVLAAAFLLAVGVGALVSRKPGREWAAPLAVISLAALAGMLAIGAALSWPTANQSITDMMTDHFTQPATSDMYIRFLHLEVRFWRAFLTQISGGAYLVVLAVLGLWGVVRWLHGAAAAAFLTVAAVGAASLALHPGDWSRMLAPLWIVVAVGLPFLAASYQERPAAECPGIPPDLSARSLLAHHQDRD